MLSKEDLRLLNELLHGGDLKTEEDDEKKVPSKEKKKVKEKFVKIKLYTNFNY